MLDDIYQVTISMRLQGQICQNVLFYQVTADADYVAFGAGVVDWVNGEWTPNVALLMSSALEFTNVRIQKIWPLPAFFPIDVPLLGVGLIASGAMPSEVAMVMTKQTILAGARYRGRIYLPGLPFASMNTGTGLWEGAVMIIASPAANVLASNIPSIPAGGTMKPIIYHRDTHTTTAINSAVARNVPRAQRRRQIGRGI